MLSEITENKIETNYERFKDLLRSTNRDGIEELINYLDTKTDFKFAPASTRYHGSFKGGLCEHSLNVYDILVNMNNLYKEITGECFEEDSLIIVALLHDISKVNTYEDSFQNKKIYKEDGSKWDELGNYDWVSVKSYRTKDYNDRFVFVNHELTSEFIVRQFIGLRVAESAAIVMHHNGMGHDSIPSETTGLALSKFPLALLLHSADLFAAYTIA